MAELYKFPRTPHIEGSRFQPGDEDLDNVPFWEIADRVVVVEEKCDGANSGISFDENGTLMLQSRGHFLLGGTRERHFNLFKQWAASKQRELWEILGRRYVLYGEWVYAKHTVFYDALPHYFLEFDMLDLETKQFLSTKRRRELLAGSPVVSVPVLFEGRLESHKRLAGLLGQSNYIREGHLERLQASCAALGLHPERALRETDPSVTMEGLYLKTEDDEQVTARYKYVRASFLQAVEAAEGHWLNRPIIPNQLRDEVELF
ncbi:MAG: RNA ligase family protein [Blastocatellia bacterium]|nr:RNA ligase family protein [Blastocatellia bacterium]